MSHPVIDCLVSAAVSAVAVIAALDPLVWHNDDLAIALKVAIGGLTTAIVALWAFFRSNYKDLERQLEGHKTERSDILDGRDRERSKLTSRIARLERITGIVHAVSDCAVLECALREAARHSLHTTDDDREP